MPEGMNCAVSTNEEVPVPSSDGSWMGAVQTMGAWYMANVYTYHGHCHNKCDKTYHQMYYDCNLVQFGKIRDDCSGFVTACVSYFKPSIWTADTGPLSGEFARTGTTMGKNLAANGFTYIPFDVNKLQQGDIIAFSSADNHGSSGHVEIVDEPKSYRSYSWGNMRNGKPRPSDCCKGGTASKINGASDPYTASYRPYKAIWRYTGKTSG